MPYSKHLGFIHIAIPKTGSTSLIRALKNIAEPYGGLELIKKNIDPFHSKKIKPNWMNDSNPSRWKHLSARQIKYTLGDSEFARCTKFSLVRNPWDRIISQYHFTHIDLEPTVKQKAQRMTTRKFHDMEFEEWLTRRWRSHKAGKQLNCQLNKLIDRDGKLLVDHVGRLESAQMTLDWLTHKLGVEKVKMPHVNRTRHGHYTEFYNSTTRDMVNEMYQADINFFDYSFEC